MKKTINYRLIVKCIITVIVIGGIIMGMNMISARSTYKSIDITDGWTMYNSEGGKSSINTGKEYLGLKERGDEVVLLNVIEERIDNPALYFKTYHSSVEVFVDDELIYENGVERNNRNKAVGCGYHIITLPDNYVSRQIMIKIKAGDSKPFDYIDRIEIVDTENFVKGFIGKNAFGVITTFFLTMVGMFAVIGSLLVGINKKPARKIMYVGLLSFWIGIWTQCYYGYFFLICRNTVIYYYLEHLAVYIMAIPILLFYLESVKEGILKKVLKLLLIINLAFFGIVFVLHFTDTIHLNKFVMVFHAIAVVIIFTVIVAVFTDTIDNRKAKISMGIGMLSLAAGLLIELVRYNMSMYSSLHSATSYIVSIGGLIYVISNIVASFFMLLENFEEKIREEALMKMAYGDSLTGLSNRKCCEDRMSYIDDNNIKSFAIINFDLNWLKRINDGLGHVKGDEYLCEFSSLLRECCGNKATIGRMGGDEFVAIFENANNRDMERVINEMNGKSGNGNMPETRNIGDGISFAYGYAVSSADSPLTTGKAYEIADERMYECKKKQKVGRK